MPITWLALDYIYPASLVMEIDDVLVAKMQCLGVDFARSSKMRDFRIKSSFAASIAKSMSFKCEMLSTY
jgi:hypothetical protein